MGQWSEVRRFVEPEFLGTAAHVFIDLETTGLEYDEDQILEIALAVTDKDGRILATYETLVDHQVSVDELVGMMDPHVEEMHIKSGLLNDWEMHHKVNMTNDPAGTISGAGLLRAELDIMDFLSSCKLANGTFPMAGNSVHFDRRFVERDLPSLNNFFHYRHIDMSTVKQLCRLLNPPIAEAYEKMLAEADINGERELVHHRALDDLKASIREYIFYKDNFIFVA